MYLAMLDLPARRMMVMAVRLHQTHAGICVGESGRAFLGGGLELKKKSVVLTRWKKFWEGGLNDLKMWGVDQAAFFRVFFGGGGSEGGGAGMTNLKCGAGQNALIAKSADPTLGSHAIFFSKN